VVRVKVNACHDIDRCWYRLLGCRSGFARDEEFKHERGLLKQNNRKSAVSPVRKKFYMLQCADPDEPGFPDAGPISSQEE
jgi:hypothetical protein